MVKLGARSTSVGYLVVGGIAVAGTIAGTLSATAATTLGASGNGGLITAVFLALLLVCAGIAAPWTERLAARRGPLKTFAWAQAGVAVSWIITGIIVATTDEQIVVLLIAAPVFGLLSGVTAVLTPIVTRTYFARTSIAASMSWRSAVSGLAAVAGAIIGGSIISATDPTAGVIANGLLTIPLAVFVMRVAPLREPHPPRADRGQPMRRILGSLRTNARLRQVVILAVASTLLVVPMISMIVPILNSVDHAPLPSGAGLVLAGIGAGRVVTPLVNGRVERRWGDLQASLWALVGAAVFMFAFSLSALLPLSEFDLVAWTMIGFGLGACRFTYRSLMIGAAAAAGSSEPGGDEMEGLAAVTTIGVFAAPIGVLAWGVMIDVTSSPVTVAVGASGIVLVAAFMGLALRKKSALSGDPT